MPHPSSLLDLGAALVLIGPAAYGLSGLHLRAPAENQTRVVVTVTAADYAFQAPDTIQAGEIEFRLINRGPDLHHVWLFRLDPGRRAVDLMGAFRQDERMPPWAHGVGGPNVPPPGRPSVVTVRLSPGRYALICFIKGPDGVRHIMKGMVKEMAVVGPERPGKPPKGDVTVTMTDYDFVLSTPLRRGPQVIDVRNTGAQPHMIVFFHLEPGKTVADYQRWAQRRQGPRPGKAVGGTTGMDPGVVNTVEVDLEPGEYGLACFVLDSADGKPHVAHGMVKHLTVP